MAIITDGTTTVTIPYVNEVPDPEIITASKMSASGSIKGQTSGERLKFKCDARVSSALFRSLLDLLTNASPYYYYTPEDTHGFYSGVSFPLEVRIDKVSHKWDNRNTYYINFTVEGVDYV